MLLLLLLLRLFSEFTIYSLKVLSGLAYLHSMGIIHR
jgi:serine/threonine protein kinase